MTLGDDSSLSRSPDAELLSLWARVSAELRRRGLTRSGNIPTGDYCELLVAAHFGVELQPGSHKGFDLRLANGTRVQVKGRRMTPHSRPTHFSVIRDLEEDQFDLVVAVLLDENFVPLGSWSLTPDAVRRHAKFSRRLNGWRLPLIRGAILADPEVKPIALT